jgi:Ring finger domain
MKQSIRYCLLIFIGVASLVNIYSLLSANQCPTALQWKKHQTRTIEDFIAWRKHTLSCIHCMKKRESFESDQICSICWEVCEDPEKFIRLPIQVINRPSIEDGKDQRVEECGHIFCRSCITTWFSTKKANYLSFHRECPVCRIEPGDDFIQSNLGIGAYSERNFTYLLNMASLLGIFTAEGFFAGITLGVIGRKLLIRSHQIHAETQTIFALHYLTMIFSWLLTHKLIKTIWRPAFDVDNPGAQFELIRSISRKTPQGKAALLLGSAAGIYLSKRLLQTYETFGKFLET